MCHGYNFASLNWCCQLLACFNGELNLVRWWRMFIVSALSNMGSWNQTSCDPKMQPFCKLNVLAHCLAQTCKSSTIPIDTCICDCFACFCGCNCKTSRICHEKPDFSPSDVVVTCSLMMIFAVLYLHKHNFALHWYKLNSSFSHKSHELDHGNLTYKHKQNQEFVLGVFPRHFQRLLYRFGTVCQSRSGRLRRCKFFAANWKPNFLPGLTVMTKNVSLHWLLLRDFTV